MYSEVLTNSANLVFTNDVRPVTRAEVLARTNPVHYCFKDGTRMVWKPKLDYGKSELGGVQRICIGTWTCPVCLTKIKVATTNWIADSEVSLLLTNQVESLPLPPK